MSYVEHRDLTDAEKTARHQAEYLRKHFPIGRIEVTGPNKVPFHGIEDVNVVQRPGPFTVQVMVDSAAVERALAAHSAAAPKGR